MAHLYYNRLRPVGLGTIPKVEWAWVEQPGIEAYRPRDSKLPISRKPYGVFRTERPLTPAELYDFEISELIPASYGDGKKPRYGVTYTEDLTGEFS